MNTASESDRFDQAARLLESTLIPLVETALKKEYGENWTVAVSAPVQDGRVVWDVASLLETIRGNPQLFPKELQGKVKPLEQLWAKRERLSGHEERELGERARALLAHLSPGAEAQLIVEPPQAEQSAEIEELGIDDEEPAPEVQVAAAAPPPTPTVDIEEESAPEVPVAPEAPPVAVEEEAEPEPEAALLSSPLPAAEPEHSSTPEPEEDTVTPVVRRRSPLVRALAALPLLALLAVAIVGAVAVWQSTTESQKETHSGSTGTSPALKPPAHLPPAEKTPQKQLATPAEQEAGPQQTPPATATATQDSLVLFGVTSEEEITICGGYDRNTHEWLKPERNVDRWIQTTWQSYGIRFDKPVTLECFTPSRINRTTQELRCLLRTPAARGVVVAGLTDARPRVPAREYPVEPVGTATGITQTARRLLTAKGFPQTAEIYIKDAYKVDLDGDGRDEELWSVRSEEGGPSALGARWRDGDTMRTDDYALVAIRNDASLLRTVALFNKQTSETSGSARQAPEFELLSPVDLTGDGRMEILVYERYTGFHHLSVYSFDGETVRKVF